MYLESDAFEVAFDPDKVNTENIMATIAGLGYKPRAAEIPPRITNIENQSKPGVPEPLLSALESLTQQTNGLLFIDFHAKWCAPCKALEAEVLSAPEVIDALNTFTVLQIDTDAFSEAAKHFGIRTLPTLLVIDANAQEQFKHVGPIKAATLIAHLQELRLENARN